MRMSKRSLMAVCVLTVVLGGAAEALAAPAGTNPAASAPRDVIGAPEAEGGGGGHHGGGSPGGHNPSNPSNPSPHEPVPYIPPDDLGPEVNPHGNNNNPQSAPLSEGSCSLMGCTGFNGQTGKCTGCGGTED